MVTRRVFLFGALAVVVALRPKPKPRGSAYSSTYSNTY